MKGIQPMKMFPLGILYGIQIAIEMIIYLVVVALVAVLYVHDALNSNYSSFLHAYL